VTVDHGLDAGDVDGAQAVDVADDAGQLGHEGPHLGVVEGEAGEAGELLDGGVVDAGHVAYGSAAPAARQRFP
jgi:hypothetical protein